MLYGVLITQGLRKQGYERISHLKKLNNSLTV